MRSRAGFVRDLLAVLDFLELGVHHVVVDRTLGLGMRLRLLGGTRCGCGGGLRALGVGVHLLAELLAGGHQGFGLGLDVGLVVALDGLFQRLGGGFDLVLFAGLELVAVLGQRLAHAVHHAIGLVASGDEFDLLLVLGGIGLGVLHHLLDLGLAQARVRLDGDLVFFAGALVLGADVQDAVGVDVEAHLDLGHAARRRRDAFEVELAQRLVGLGQLALALVDLDGHGRLVVVGGREGLAELGRDGRVLLDHLRHHAAERLDAERQRGDVEQQHILALAAQDLALDGRADGDGFVGVHVTARLLAEELLDLLLHLGHAGHAADQDDVIDGAHGDTGVLDGGAAGRDGALDQFVHQRLQLGAGELDVQVLGAGRIGGDVGQVDVGLRAVGQLDLGLLGGFLQALQGQHVLGQVDALFLFELGNDVVDDPLVEVLAAEEGVAVGRQHFELHLAIDIGDLDDRDVEGAAAEVIDGDLAVALAMLVQAEGQGRGSGLVDDALDVQAGDAAGVLGGLALGVVEVGRHRDDGLGHFLAEVVLSRLLHLAQHLGADLRRGQLLAAHFHPGVAVVGGGDGVGHQVDVLLHFLLGELAADQALDRVERVLGVGDGLALGRGADEDLAVFLVGNDGRRRACTLGVLDHAGGVAFHDRDARVGGAEVNADDLSHFFCS
mmetsp:Transcript_9996/g.40531  ORF Transcript_9996/g.40531 Transcript_9996/m.40531 type:complete len:666 (-) Transcript_9996:681-2678(-)